MKLPAITLVAALTAITFAANAREMVPVTEGMKESAKESIRAVLKDPDSAKFSDFRAYMSGGKTDVCGKVNSKNSYGGYSGDAWFVVPDGMKPMIYANRAKGANANNSIVKALCKL